MILSHMLLRLLAVLVLNTAAFSATFTQVVAFGDSLSDNGNTFTKSGGVYPMSPTTMGRQSSGFVAVEYLAQTLGVNLDDRAWIGATTGQGNSWDGGSVSTRVGLPGMMSALNEDLSAGLVVHPGALYVVWGGPNDILAITGPADAPAVISQAITNLVTFTAILQGLGAQHIIVPGMPDLSLTPRVQFLDTMQPGTAALLQFVSLTFNQALAASLPAGATYFDTNGVFLNVYNNPSAYGFQSVSTPCVVGPVVCATPSNYLFWDDLHPTTEAHKVLGDALAAAAVPEPSTWVTVLAGLAVVGLKGRREMRLRVRRDRLASSGTMLQCQYRDGIVLDSISDYVLVDHQLAAVPHSRRPSKLWMLAEQVNGRANAVYDTRGCFWTVGCNVIIDIKQTT